MEEIRRQAGLVLRLAEYLRAVSRWRKPLWSDMDIVSECPI